jgi:hemerythrin-like domain-containing protein
MGKISEFMLKEHGEILALLEKYQKGKKKEDFEKLKEKQERHILGEEKAIFIFYKGKRGFEILSIILEQHEQLLRLEKAIENGEDKFNEMKDLFAKHIKLEDREFYPRIDKELSVVEQQKVIANAKNWILGNIALD